VTVTVDASQCSIFQRESVEAASKADLAAA
jgi:hypothetical protein